MTNPVEPQELKQERNDLIALYFYQILHGCGDQADSACNNPFCCNNFVRKFAGRKLAKDAAMVFAVNMASTEQDNSLCAVFKTSPSKRKYVIDQVNLDSPLESSFLKSTRSTQSTKTTTEYNKLRQSQRRADALNKRKMSLSHILCRAMPLCSWFWSTAQFYEILSINAYSYLSYRSQLNLHRYKTILERFQDGVTSDGGKFSDILRAVEVTYKHLSLINLMQYTQGQEKLSQYNEDKDKSDEDEDVDVLNVPDYIQTETGRVRPEVRPSQFNADSSIFHVSVFGEYKLNIGMVASLTMDGVFLFRSGILRLMHSTMQKALHGGQTRGRFLEHEDYYPNGEDLLLGDGTVCSEFDYFYGLFYLNVDRWNFLDSTIKSLTSAMQITDLILRPLKVCFVNETLTMDQGGVQQEFFDLLGSTLMSPEYGLFTENPESNVAWFSSSYTGDTTIYEYIGVLFGLALYNQCTISISFPEYFYFILSSENRTIDEEFLFNIASELMPRLSSTLNSAFKLSSEERQKLYLDEPVINYTLDTGEVAETSFSYAKGDTDSDTFLNYSTQYLITRVTLNNQLKALRAFLKGFWFVISSDLLQLLQPDVLHTMLEGEPYFSVPLAKKNASYEGFTASSPTVVYFWEVLEEMPLELQFKFLEFVTGTKNLPLGGTEAFTLTITNNGNDYDKLPTSFTCFGSILLPTYRSKQELKEKLYKAIEYSRGFGAM